MPLIIYVTDHTQIQYVETKVLKHLVQLHDIWITINGLFYLNSLDRSISCIRGVWLVFLLSCFVEIPVLIQTLYPD